MMSTGFGATLVMIPLMAVAAMTPFLVAEARTLLMVALALISRFIGILLPSRLIFQPRQIPMVLSRVQAAKRKVTS